MTAPTNPQASQHASPIIRAPAVQISFASRHTPTMSDSFAATTSPSAGCPSPTPVPISTLIGLPLLAVKITNGTQGKGDEDTPHQQQPQDNQSAGSASGSPSASTAESRAAPAARAPALGARRGPAGAALFVEIAATRAAFGRVEEEWASAAGVVVWRADGRDFSVLHAEALCAYCNEDLGPAFDFSAEMGDDEGLREDVLGLISRERFVGFWEVYRAKQCLRKGWADAKNPFEV